MELLRRAVRGVVGYDSSVYRAAANVTNFVTIASHEGPATWAALRKLQAKTPATGAVPMQLKLSKLAHPITLRPGTEDATTVISTVVREEYGKFKPLREPLVMIDAGTYIGDTSAYFLTRFKQLRIFGIEPSPISFQAAAANLSPYGDRVTLLNKGLAAEAGRFKFTGDDTGAQLGDSGTEIDCTSIPELIETYKLDRIDVLKMDIEGAETAIFAADPGRWLQKVDTIMIELHGAEAERVVLGALRAARFDIRQYRSIYYCTRTT